MSYNIQELEKLKRVLQIRVEEKSQKITNYTARKQKLQDEIDNAFIARSALQRTLVMLDKIEPVLFHSSPPGGVMDEMTYKEALRESQQEHIRQLQENAQKFEDSVDKG